MAESISIPGTVSIPDLTGGAGGSASGSTSNFGINFGTTQVGSQDKSTILILAAAALAFFWVSKNA